MVKYVVIGILHSLLDFDSQLQQDKQLARALQDSLNAESPPRYGNGIGNAYAPPRVPMYYPIGSSLLQLGIIHTTNLAIRRATIQNVIFASTFSKMSLRTKIKPLLSLWRHLLICTLLFTSLPVATASSDDYTSLVFNGCSKNMFPNNVYPENLKPLMDSLVSNSAQKTFFAATATSSDGTNGINGLYQCRGDLSPAECNTCVSKIPPLVTQLCGQTNVAARVQLRRCYLRYEIADAKPLDATEFLFKRCDVYQAKVGGLGVKRDTAFGVLENNVKNSTSNGVGTGGFYTGSYDTVGVSGQCEGSLANQDCVACLLSASQKAKTECGDSISGQIYLYKCYIGYNTSNGNANAVPYSRKVDAGSGNNNPVMKMVAIPLGAIFGFLLVVCIGWVIYTECRKTPLG